VDIETIDNFFSKTAFNDFWNLFYEPKWGLRENITTPENKGAGLERYLGAKDEAFHLSLFPVHVISRELNKEYYCERMRLRVTWPFEKAENFPHYDRWSEKDDYDITAIIHMNDSDGDLIIYDSIGPEPFDKKAKSIEFTPKGNRCIIMMKKYYHHAMRPVETELRYSININLKEHKQ